MPVQEKKPRSRLVAHLTFLFLYNCLIISFFCQFSELQNSVFVYFKFLKVAFESLNSLFELVLLKDDLSQLPFAQLFLIFCFFKAFRLKKVKRFVGNILAKVNGFKLFVKGVESLFNHVVKEHSGCHEARFDGLHSTYVIAFLSYRHIIELF